MTDIQAIENRISRRCFLQIQLSDAEISKIESKIIDINNAKDLRFEFVENGSKAFNSITKTYGSFSGVRSLMMLKGKKDDVNLDEKVGYCGEELVLMCTGMGLGTCWVGTTFDKNSSVISVGEDERLVCVIIVGNIGDKQTLKEKLMGKVVKKSVKDIEDMFLTDRKEIPEWFAEGMRCAQRAPSALNTQKTMFQYKNQTVKASIANDYKFDMVDLGIAKLHFEIGAVGKFDLGNGGGFKKKD